MPPGGAAAHLVPRVKQCVQGSDIRNELLQGEVFVVVDAVCVVHALMLLRGAEGVEQVGDEDGAMTATDNQDQAVETLEILVWSTFRR